MLSSHLASPVGARLSLCLPLLFQSLGRMPYFIVIRTSHITFSLLLADLLSLYTRMIQTISSFLREK